MLWFAAVGLAACSGEAGSDGSSILVPYSALSGGMVFATAAYRGNHGYDLLWVPAPATVTLDPLPAVRLTNADGNEWQPSVSAGGNGMAFARDGDGIYFVATSGRVSRISDSGSQFVDATPAVSADGAYVAWVRMDRSRPIGDTGQYENQIMISTVRDKVPRPLLPRPGIVQDAPSFEPVLGSNRIAWTEFVPTPPGIMPQTFQVWIHDIARNTGFTACDNRQTSTICFGEHLAWARPNKIVLGQTLTEISVPELQIGVTLFQNIASQFQNGVAFDLTAHGFFRGFPLSVSFDQRMARFVVDGIFAGDATDAATVGFVFANEDGSGGWRPVIDGYTADYDSTHTGNYAYSVATPQLVP